MQGDERLIALSKRMKGEIDAGVAHAPERVTIREFLSWFSYTKRGSWINRHIRNKMEELDLRTVPDFESGWFGATISIGLDPEAVAGLESSDESVDPTVRIGTLEAANRKPTSVKPDNPLKVATTLMQLSDFSQLPVMTGEYNVKGVISWKSIGTRFSSGRECELVRHCMDPVSREIGIDAPMFDAIEDISQHGYVLVRGLQNNITGIVTASDFAGQFSELAGPFLLIGEIEGYLRSIVHRKFTLGELQKASYGSESGPPIEGSADLTFGGYCRLMQSPNNWKKLRLTIDRGEFVKYMDEVREIRNAVMHFNPDGLDQDHKDKLRNGAMFFRNLSRLAALESPT
jgi:CBS domain-containing protein